MMENQGKIYFQKIKRVYKGAHVFDFTHHVPTVDHCESASIATENIVVGPESSNCNIVQENNVELDQELFIESGPSSRSPSLDREEIYEKHIAIENGLPSSFQYMVRAINMIKRERGISIKKFFGYEFMFNNIHQVAVLCLYVAHTGKTKTNKRQQVIGDMKNKAISVSTAVKATRKFLTEYKTYTVAVPIGDLTKDSLLFVQRNGEFGPLMQEESLYSFRHYTPAKKYFKNVMDFCQELVSNKKKPIDLMAFQPKNDGYAIMITARCWSKIEMMLLGGWKPFGDHRENLITLDRSRREYNLPPSNEDDAIDN